MGIQYNSASVLDGLELSLDFANSKNYSYNVFPYPLNINTWLTVNSGLTNNCTVSADSTQYSPVGGTPMKMVVTNLDPFIDTYNQTKWNLASASVGETWTASVWVKADTSLVIETPVVFEGTVNGGYNRVASTGVNVDTNWKKISTSITIQNANTTNIKVRLDGNNTGGTGTIWWDGLQVEKSLAATTFNPKTNTNGNTVTETLSTSNFVFHGDGYWAHENSENRKNYIRNSIAIGSVAGTPGTLPTNWGSFFAPTGITRTVVGSGTISGIPYVDVQFSGTASGVGELSIYPESSSMLPFPEGTSVSGSAWVAIVGGSTSNISSTTFRLISYLSGTYLSESSTAISLSSTLAQTSLNYTTALTSNSVLPVISVNVAAAGAINITLRVGLPKLEYGTQTVGVLTFDRTQTTAQKYGGGAYRTMTGNLTASKFLYNNHTWEIWFRINDRSVGGYGDVTETFSTLMLYRGYHAGFSYSSSSLSYVMWSGIAGSNTVCSWTLGNSGAQINQGSWHQLAVTRAGNVFTPYVNGVQLGTGTTSVTSNVGIATSDELWMGKTAVVAANTGSYLYYSKNTIGATKMYTRALGAPEIQQNFNALRGRYGI